MTDFEPNQPQSAKIPLTKVPVRILTWFVQELVFTGRVLYSSLDRFYWDNGFGRSAALAYSTLLALVPVLALSGSILAAFIVRGDEIPQVTSFVLRQFLPNLEVVELENGTVIAPPEADDKPLDLTLGHEGKLTDQRSTSPMETREGEKTVPLTAKGVIEGELRVNKQALDEIIFKYIQDFGEALSKLNQLVVVFLVITAVLLFNAIEYALNEVWQVHQSRSVSSRIGIFSAIIVIWPILALSAFYTANFLAGIEFSGTIYALYSTLLPFLIDFLAFLMLYFVVPKAPVWFRSAAFGAFVSAALFGAAKAIFAVYIFRFTSYARIYETLAVIPIFLFWLYCVWSIVLLGAEISYQAQYLPRKGRLFKRALLSVGDGRLVLGLQALTVIAKAFLSGKTLPTERELAELLGCSSMVLKPALDALEGIGVIARSADTGGRITLARSVDRISLHELQRALLPGVAAPRFPKELSMLFGALVDSKRTAGSQEVTFGQLLTEKIKA